MEREQPHPKTATGFVRERCHIGADVCDCPFRCCDELCGFEKLEQLHNRDKEASRTTHEMVWCGVWCGMVVVWWCGGVVVWWCVVV
jgi:hypothetical protein